MQHHQEFDTIILGSGISGTALASILAKQGYRVLILEKGTHPRFAIGESMLPQTSMWMWIVGERFGIPEIQHLANPKKVRKHVSSSCGVKRSVGFIYHRQDEVQNPQETFQVIPPDGLFFSESHLYRQEVDEYMLKVAINYGAIYRDLTEVTDINFQEDGVTVQVHSGEEYQARFLVDGSGFRSILANKLNLRENPTRLKTKSRTMFTHVAGLRPYAECTKFAGQGHGWHEGTLHHVFDGGWLWIIPFDNHNDSHNTLSSIGLMLDPQKFPKQDLTPEEEFQQIIDRFPSIAEQVKTATPVRKWICAEQIQYSSTTSVGNRWAMLSHSYGFIDPLYSRGLISTFETINALASRLLEALKDDDFSVERFAYINRLQTAQLDDTDKLIHNAYRCMSNFELWNAWTQMWLATKMLGDTYLFRSCLKYMDSKDASLFSLLEEDPCPGAQAPYASKLNSILNRSSFILDQVEAGLMIPKEGADKILKLLREFEFLPKSVYPWGISEARYINFNNLFRDWITWGKTDAPSIIKEKMFDFELMPAAFVS